MFPRILAASLACFAAAPGWPQAITAAELQAQQLRIEEDYDHAKTRCQRVLGPARALCKEAARGERNVQAAQLRLRAQPTPENDHRLRMARADARYATSLVRCRELEGQARRVCRDDAQAVHGHAQTEARLQLDGTSAR
jgi:hypothetical protein